MSIDNFSNAIKSAAKVNINKYMNTESSDNIKDLRSKIDKEDIGKFKGENI